MVPVLSSTSAVADSVEYKAEEDSARVVLCFILVAVGAVRVRRPPPISAD